MKIPTISVIIPVYNVERYVKRCLDSLLVQSFRDFEVVIVNDATPDKSMDIVNAFCKKWEAVTIVKHEKNMGLMWARLSGYQKATGKYFVFLDSDDWLPKRSLETLKDAIEKTKADIVSGAFSYVKDDGSVSIRGNCLNYGNSPKSVFKAMLKHEFYHCLWGKIYRSDLFKLHKYDTFECFTNGEDALLFHQLLMNAKKIVSIPESVYFYYCNISSACNKKLSNRAIETIVFTNKYCSNEKILYPDLAKGYDANISSSLINLIYTTRQRSLLLSLIKKYELEYYVKNITILKSHSVINGLKLLIKKYL